MLQDAQKAALAKKKAKKTSRKNLMGTQHQLYIVENTFGTILLPWDICLSPYS